MRRQRYGRSRPCPARSCRCTHRRDECQASITADTMAALKREAVRVIWGSPVGIDEMGNGLKPASHGLRVCQWKGLTEFVAVGQYHCGEGVACPGALWPQQIGKQVSSVRPGLPIGLADAENPHVVVAAFSLKEVLHQHFEGAGEEFGTVRPVGWCCMSGRAYCLLTWCFPF